MDNLKIASYVSGLLILSSCFFGSGGDKIIGRYSVRWIDVAEQQFICENVSGSSTSCLIIISEYVFAVGHNSDFIIAKQHPTNGPEGGYEIDTTITNFYIIDMHRKLIKKGDNVIGPLTEKQFDQKIQELNIENIEFSLIYPKLPQPQ